MAEDYKIIDSIKSKFGNQVLESHAFRGDQTVTINKHSMVDIFKFLRDDPDHLFNFLMDITAVDYLNKKSERFEVIYHLYSHKFNSRVRIKIQVCEEDCFLDSLVSLWLGANWYEREIWDLYGIKFKGHPNLRRILLYDEFKGHPLRKDYPVNKRQPLIGPMN